MLIAKCYIKRRNIVYWEQIMIIIQRFWLLPKWDDDQAIVDQLNQFLVVHHVTITFNELLRVPLKDNKLVVVDYLTFFITILSLYVHHNKSKKWFLFLSSSFYKFPLTNFVRGERLKCDRDKEKNK